MSTLGLSFIGSIIILFLLAKIVHDKKITSFSFSSSIIAPQEFVYHRLHNELDNPDRVLDRDMPIVTANIVNPLPS